MNGRYKCLEHERRASLLVQDIIIRAKFRIARALHLTENRKIAILEFAHLSLQLRSIAVPQCILEKILTRLRGQ